jgi:hypothetical protein
LSGIEFDFSEVAALAADLGEVPKGAGVNIRKAVEVTARRVKDQWRSDVAGSSLSPGGERSIDYDVKGDGFGVTAEVGARLGGAGSLVGWGEYGTPHVAPRGYGAGALQMNEADFQRGLEVALEQAERSAGL